MRPSTAPTRPRLLRFCAVYYPGMLLAVLGVLRVAGGSAAGFVLLPLGVVLVALSVLQAAREPGLSQGPPHDGPPERSEAG